MRSVALGLASPCGNVSFLLGSESPERSRSPRSVESVLGGGCSRRAAPCPLPAHTESHSSCAPAPGGPSDHTSQPRSRGQRPQGPFKQTRLGRCCRGPACDPIRHPQRPCLWTLQLRGPQGRSLCTHLQNGPSSPRDHPKSTLLEQHSGKKTSWSLWPLFTEVKMRSKKPTLLHSFS